MAFSFALPGLFDFTTGRASATNQRLLGAQASSAEADSFVNQLNAFNASLNTNDNLQFRRGFAEQPQGTSILDRFNNIAANASSPFVTQQALLQQQSLAPLLAQSSLQNPFFGAQQGLPSTAQSALNQGYLGLGNIFQQQYNQGLPALFQTNNPGIDPTNLASSLAVQLGLAQQNAQQNDALNTISEVRKQNEFLQKALLQLRGGPSSNSPATSAANTAAPVNNADPRRFALSIDRLGTVPQGFLSQEYLTGGSRDPLPRMGILQ